MSSLSLRDRFFTPRVAHAVTSPSGILAFGGGIAAGVVVAGAAAMSAPLTVPLALAGGVLAYAGRVALAIPPKHADVKLDPFSVQEPWRHAVIDAAVARKRFDEAVRTFKSGPLREALSAMGDQLDAAISECWKVARQGQLVTDARQRIDARGVQAELQRVSLGIPAGAAPSPTQASTLASLQSQLATAERMDRLVSSTRDELDLLNARLDESVTQAIELSISNRAGGLDPLSGQLDDIVDDLSSLRAAFDTVDHGDPSETIDLGDVTSSPTATTASPPPPPAPPFSTS
jgi:hypothetical protein